MLCGADEVAVELFLSRRIKFTDIAKLVEQTLEQHQFVANPTLEEIVAAYGLAPKDTGDDPNYYSKISWWEGTFSGHDLRLIKTGKSMVIAVV